MTRTTKDKLLDAVRKYAGPVATALVLVTGHYMHVLKMVEANVQEIQNLREMVSDIRDCGPDGFLHPSSHSAHDLHIRHWLESELGRAGWRRLVNQFGQNGGSE